MKIQHIFSILFLSFGIILNPITVAIIYTKDGKIDNFFIIFIIILFDLLCIFIGIIIIKYKNFLVTQKMKFKKICFFLCYILFFLCFIEYMSYLMYNLVTPPVGRFAVEVMSGSITEKAIGQRIISHPYLLYQSTPNWSNGKEKIINSLGYRNNEFCIEKKPNEIRILALGGSTTYCYPYVKNNNDIWTSILETKLSAHYKKNIQVINAGLPCATSAELLAGYIFRHRFLKPDIIIIHAGGNDVGPLLFDGYNPEYTHFRSSAGHSRRFGEKYVLKSFTLKILYSWWFSLQGGLPSYISQPKPLSKLDRSLVLSRVKNTYPEGFERNMNLILKLAHYSGIKVILFGFIQAPEDLLGKKNPSLIGLEKALSIGLKKNYMVMDKLQKKYDNVTFIKPDPNLFRNDHFIDNCHLDKEGERIKATILIEYFLDDNMFKDVFK